MPESSGGRRRAGIVGGLEECLYPAARELRCRNHRIMNIVDRVKKRDQASATKTFCEIAYAEDRNKAESEKKRISSVLRECHSDRPVPTPSGSGGICIFRSYPAAPSLKADFFPIHRDWRSARNDNSQRTELLQRNRSRVGAKQMATVKPRSLSMSIGRGWWRCSTFLRSIGSVRGQPTLWRVRLPRCGCLRTPPGGSNEIGQRDVRGLEDAHSCVEPVL